VDSVANVSVVHAAFISRVVKFVVWVMSLYICVCVCVLSPSYAMQEGL
jgi:hypothetical protein